MMPKIDGFTLAEKIIKINPEVPFVFLTARKLKDDKIKGLKLGADDYIVKPFEADELVLRLNNILKEANSLLYLKLTNCKLIYLFDTKRLCLKTNPNTTTHRKRSHSFFTFIKIKW
jgi:DNA-binding response OmpR family regulator